MEKTNFETPDTVRIHVYASEPNAKTKVSAELVKTKTFSGIALSAPDPLASPKDAPGLEVVSAQKSKKLSSKYTTTFVSTVGEDYPPENNAATRKGVVLDDKQKMSAANRKSGALLELLIPKGAEPTFSEAGAKVEYYTLVCADICIYTIMIGMFWLLKNSFSVA